VARAHVGTLTALWLTASGIALLAAAIVLRGRTRGTVASPREAIGGGYRSLAGDRALGRALCVALVVMVAGYGLYNCALPPLAISAGDPGALVWANVGNCATVVLGLPLALWATRRLGRRALRWAALVWPVGWLACLLAADTGLLAIRAAVVVAGVTTALGELLVAGALPAMVNDLAPEHLRGRYNAAYTFTATAANLVTPLVVALATGAGAVPGVFLAGVVLFALLPLLLRRTTARPRPVLVEAR
jgi:hypothetical protein